MIRVLSVVCASILLSTCGDMSELQEDELREFIRKAKRVVTDELFSDYDKDQIETVEEVIAEVLTEDDEVIDDGDTVVANNRCSEVGRKTVYSANNLPIAGLANGVKVNLSAKSDGLECTAEGTAEETEVSVSCMKGACSCDAISQTDQSSDNYQADCTDSAISGANRAKTFIYTEDEVAAYGDDLPDFPATITVDEQGGYRLIISSPANKKELEMFAVSIIGETGAETTILTADKDKSLRVYDSQDRQLTDKLARWPSKVGDDIFNLQIDAGDDANFNVFLVKDARQTVKTIAGYVDEQLSPTAFVPMEQDREITMTVSVHRGSNGNLAIFDFSGDPDPGPLPTGSNAGIDFISVDGNGIVKELRGSGNGGINSQQSGGRVRLTPSNFVCQVNDTVYVRINNNIYQATCTQGQ